VRSVCSGSPVGPKPGNRSPSTRDERAGQAQHYRHRQDGSAEALNCFVRVRARLISAGHGSLNSARPRALREWARRPTARCAGDPLSLKEVSPPPEGLGTAWKGQAASSGHSWPLLMIPERVPLAVMNEEGLDTDIAELLSADSEEEAGR